MNSAEFCSQLLPSMYSMKSYLQKLMEPLAQSAGLTALQVLVLGAIQSGKASTVGRLSNLLLIGQGNTSTMCKNLERDGFLERRRSTKDERIVELILTEQGVQAMSQVHAQFECFNPIVEQISDEEMDLMLQGFEQMTNTIKKMLHHRQQIGKDDSAC